MSLARHMIISAVLLGLFAIVGTAMVALIHDATAERIAANHRAFLLKSLVSGSGSWKDFKLQTSNFKPQTRDLSSKLFWFPRRCS